MGAIKLRRLHLAPVSLNTLGTPRTAMAEGVDTVDKPDTYVTFAGRRPYASFVTVALHAYVLGAEASTSCQPVTGRISEQLSLGVSRGTKRRRRIVSISALEIGLR